MCTDSRFRDRIETTIVVLLFWMAAEIASNFFSSDKIVASQLEDHKFEPARLVNFSTWQFFFGQWLAC